MRHLKNFIIESNNKVIHEKGNGTGSFSFEGANLNYCTEIMTYPEPTNNAFEISEFYVPKNKRRMHIGTLLINEFLKFAKSENKNVVLYADPINNDDISEEDLIKFYNKFGFVQDNRVKDKKCLILKN